MPLLGICNHSYNSDHAKPIQAVAHPRGSAVVRTTMMWTDDESNEIRVQFNQGVVTDKILTASDLSLWERLKRRVSRRVRGLWPGS